MQIPPVNAYQKIGAHSMPPGWSELYLEPLLVTSPVCRADAFHLLACQCRLASLVASSTFHIGLLLSLGQSCRVTCHQRFLPWFLELWRRHSCTFWRMIAGRNLGYRAVDTRHPVGASVCLGLG